MTHASYPNNLRFFKRNATKNLLARTIIALCWLIYAWLRWLAVICFRRHRRSDAACPQCTCFALALLFCLWRRLFRLVKRGPKFECWHHERHVAADLQRHVDLRLCDCKWFGGRVADGFSCGNRLCVAITPRFVLDDWTKLSFFTYFGGATNVTFCRSGADCRNVFGRFQFRIHDRMDRQASDAGARAVKASQHGITRCAGNAFRDRTYR